MNWKRGMSGFKDEPLSLEQAEKLNSIFKKYKLNEMSMASYSIWFVNSAIYRKINHLSRNEIFMLDNELIDTVFTISYIIDGTTKSIEIVVNY